jgi:hypothetical protein
MAKIAIVLASTNKKMRKRKGPRNAVSPEWDKTLRELSVGKVLIKRFKVPSPNQELILDAFQEEGWPVCIDDPLPPVPELDSKQRLHDTIDRLNRSQINRRLRFRGNGNGRGIRWEWIADKAPIDRR